ncbi:MAG: DUF3253 domain-containing protein [Chthoniobacterales bacterium]
MSANEKKSARAPDPRPPSRGKAQTPNEDAYHFVIKGRRWRKTDPNIPEKLRAELVKELMAARRVQNRPRVQDAKVALGERGEKWWEEVSFEGQRKRLLAATRALLRARPAISTICPSDAARIAGGKAWRSLLPQARAVAREAARAGEIIVTQRDKTLELDVAWRGPVRLRFPEANT